MSLSSSLTGLSFSGISSGIDTESIISRLLLLDQSPIQRLQAQQATLTSKLGLMSSFRSKLGAMTTALAALGTSDAFHAVSASTSDSDVASVTALPNAQVGTSALKVFSLAQAHKIGSSAQASVDQPLGFAGQIAVNGKAISIETEDSLKSIAEKINDAVPGIKASVVDGGAGNAFLSLSSLATGAAASIRISDVTGAVAADLGFISGPATLVDSAAFASAISPIGDLMGFTSAPAGSFTINGVAITADLGADSLQDLADRINASGSGATASLKSEGGKVRLSLSGVTSSSDDDHILHAIGSLQEGFGNELVAGQEAHYAVDGIDLYAAGNTISGVIPGVTITLKKASPAGAETVIGVSRDIEGIRGKIDSFVEQYNTLIDFVRSNTGFDKDSFETGPLFGDFAISGAETSLTNLIFTQLKGNSGLLSGLADIGITLDQDGKLNVDETRLDGQLQTNLNSIESIFRSSGTTSVKALEFLGGTSKTKPSGTPGYQVNITALAAKLQAEAAEAQAGALAQDEVLTFTGAAFAGGSYEVTLTAGMTQQQVIDKLNADPKLKKVLEVSSAGGKLQIHAKEYGTAAAFAVASNVASGNGGTGWGSGVILQAASDVAGTINGEEAVGAGQVLTGKSGNQNTDGLQVKYTGNALGVAGSVTFAQGLSELMSGLMQKMTDSVNGSLTTNDKAIQDQIDSIAGQISFKQQQLAAKKAILQARFNRMEQMIAELQAQQARIASFTQ